MTPDELLERIALRTEMRGECIEWLGYRNATGYGRIWFDGENRFVHRVVYELVVGSIGRGLHLDHLCRNPACCRADHLEPVTPRENILRGIAPAALNARKTECVRGHPLDGENLRIRPTGERECIACRRERRQKERSTDEYREARAAYLRAWRSGRKERAA